MSSQVGGRHVEGAGQKAQPVHQDKPEEEYIQASQLEGGEDACGVGSPVCTKCTVCAMISLECVCGAKINEGPPIFPAKDSSNANGSNVRTFFLKNLATKLNKQ